MLGLYTGQHGQSDVVCLLWLCCDDVVINITLVCVTIDDETIRWMSGWV